MRRDDTDLVLDRSFGYIFRKDAHQARFPETRVRRSLWYSFTETQRREIEMLRMSLCLVSLLTATSSTFGQDEGAKQILAQFDDMRPTANELGMYRLDWAGSLDEALQRAVEERRPVFLIVIHAKYGDVSSGHC